MCYLSLTRNGTPVNPLSLKHELLVLHESTCHYPQTCGVGVLNYKGIKMDYDKLAMQLYRAFIKAAKETGDSYKKISWFTRNKGENEK